MILKQFYLSCLAHASYIVIDERTKVAAVIDPQRDVDQYLEEAEKHGAQIRYVILTHFHADFIAGHLELRNRVGAQIYLGAKATAEYDFTPLEDGDVLEFGDVSLRIKATPGHTPEGISILVYDLSQSHQKPHAVFTGDTLFVGDVGRPDLMASIGISAEELAGMLYDSLHEKLMPLPDATLVYPAHGAGSMCGKNLGKETFTTIGEQRKFNYALQPMSREKFIEIVTAEQPEAPSYFSYDAQMNRSERATLEDNLEQSLHPLSFKEMLIHEKQHHQVVDVREPADFAGAHIAGSINLPLDGRFATWAGTLLDRDEPIVIVAEPGAETEAAMRLGRIGLDRVAGFVEGGMAALDGHPEEIAAIKRATVLALEDQLQDENPPLVVDVRTAKEWEAGHIDCSVNIPLSHLVERSEELPKDREIALICRTGYRSSAASSLLKAKGFENLQDTVGGMEAWTASGLAVTEESAGTCSNS